MEEIKVSPKDATQELQIIPYMVGGQSLSAVVVVWIIKRWLNGMLTKIGAIDTILSQLIEYKKDFEHIREKLAEMKPTVQKVDHIDKQVAILDTHVAAAHRRLDQIMKN